MATHVCPYQNPRYNKITHSYAVLLCNTTKQPASNADADRNRYLSLFFMNGLARATQHITITLSIIDTDT